MEHELNKIPLSRDGITSDPADQKLFYILTAILSHNQNTYSISERMRELEQQKRKFEDLPLDDSLDQEVREEQKYDERITTFRQNVIERLADKIRSEGYDRELLSRESLENEIIRIEYSNKDYKTKHNLQYILGYALLYRQSFEFKSKNKTVRKTKKSVRKTKK